jgi:membrane protein DedA with SNARE-associated domain
MDIVPSVVNWIAAHPHYAYVAVFLLALFEAVPFAGGFVPGSTAIVGVGALAQTGAVDLWIVIATAISGAVIGDGLSYGLGHYYGGTIRKLWPFNRHPELITRSKNFFRAHGGKSIFVARFVPPVRAVVPVVAGILRVEPHNFFFANIPAVAIWALLHIFSGVAIGKSFTHFGGKVEHAAIAAILFFVGLGILVWIVRVAKLREKPKRKKAR